MRIVDIHCYLTSDLNDFLSSSLPFFSSYYTLTTPVNSDYPVQYISLNSNDISMVRDGRKRGYSQAFQLVMSAMPHRRAQVPRTMTATALSEASTPLEFEWCNKENENPFEDSLCGPFLYNAGQVSSPVLPQSDFHWPPGSTPMPLPQVKAQPNMPQPLQKLIQLPFKSTQSPQMPVGRSGFRPMMALGSSPSGEGDILDLLNTEPGPAIFEDNTMTSDSSCPELPLPPAKLPLTPSELPMQDLSLGSDQIRPLPEPPTRPVLPRNRTTVHVVPKSEWSQYVPDTTIENFADMQPVSSRMTPSSTQTSSSSSTCATTQRRSTSTHSAQPPLSSPTSSTFPSP